MTGHVKLINQTNRASLSVSSRSSMACTFSLMGTRFVPR